MGFLVFDIFANHVSIQTNGVYAIPFGPKMIAPIGLNLLQYGFTKFCPLAIILKKIGVRE